MKKIILTLGLACSFITYCQFDISLQKHIGGIGYDDLEIYYTPDSLGYYLIGSSNSNISNDKTQNSRGGFDVWILKTDLNFNIQWDKTIGGNQDDFFNNALITDSVIYCLVNTSSTASGELTATNKGNSDYWLLKLDLMGNILNQVTYGGSGYDNSSKLIEWNGDFLLFGTSDSPVSGDKTTDSKGFGDYWLLQINPNDFSILNQRVIGSSNGETLLDAAFTTNSDLFVLGYSAAGISGDKTDAGYGSSDLWMVKLDSNLNIIMNKCFGGSNSEDPVGKMISSGGFIYIINSSYSDADGNKTAPNRGSINAFQKSDIWTIKVDSNLNIIWDKTYGGTNDDYPNKIIALENGIFAAGSNSLSLQNSGNRTSPSYGGRDGWMIFFDQNGTKIGDYTVGGALDDGSSIAFQKGDTLICQGATSSNISGNQTTGTYGNYDAWLLKLVITDLQTQKIGFENQISVFPNPASSVVVFDFSNSLNDNKTLEIYTQDGKLIETLSLTEGSKEFKWNPTVLSGIYFYRIGEQTGKIVLNR